LVILEGTGGTVGFGFKGGEGCCSEIVARCLFTAFNA